MNFDEDLVYRVLRTWMRCDIRFEPCGQSKPPDFAIDDRVAIEVRRLSRRIEQNGTIKGIEESAIPLQKLIEELLKSLPRVSSGHSWFVCVNVQRRLVERAHAKSFIRKCVTQLELISEAQNIISFESELFDLTFIRSERRYDWAFSVGSWSDSADAGWVVSDIATHVNAFALEKKEKMSHLSGQYPEFWLIFVDHMFSGVSRSDWNDACNHISLDPFWSRLLVMNHHSSVTVHSLDRLGATNTFSVEVC